MIYSAEQPNGEQILYEEWVIEAWRYGMLHDSLLLEPLRNAVLIFPHGWPGARDRAIREKGGHR